MEQQDALHNNHQKLAAWTSLPLKEGKPLFAARQGLYAPVSAAVRSSGGISDIFDWFMGVKQGCPISATLFGLCVDGLEKHLMETRGHDAPDLSAIFTPLLLYADDLIIMSTTAAGLQRQLDALQQFCDQRQLSVNLTKTKVVTFGSRAKCQAFNEMPPVKCVQSYNYLGFEFHATKTLAHGVSQLLQTKQCMPCTIGVLFCASLISKHRCSLFDSLVLPNLSYASDLWVVEDGILW